MSIDFKAVRVEYGGRALLEGGVGPDPISEVACWLAEAAAAGIREPNAMTLATVSPSGHPSARVVLLKGLDARGLVFYTHYDSRKGRDLAHSPHAALCLCWPELERQVRVEGMAERLPPEESDAYFASRPRAARIGAWASEQSRPIASRASLEAMFEATFQRFVGEDVKRPGTWGGYRVVPRLVELWQGGTNRMHDRLVYTRHAEGEAWAIERLQP